MNLHLYHALACKGRNVQVTDANKEAAVVDQFAVVAAVPGESHSKAQSVNCHSQLCLKIWCLMRAGEVVC